MSHNKSKAIVYHHTSRKGAEAILQSGYIQQSRKIHGDARYGDGTYVNRMGPQIPKDEVAKNNYDGMSNYWKSHRDQGKADVALEIKMPPSRVTCYNANGRDVCKVDGNIPAKYIEKVHIRKEGDQKKYTTYTIPK